MSTAEYHFLFDEIHVDQLFDGRLETFGVREDVRNNENSSHDRNTRVLRDGSQALSAVLDENGLVTFLKSDGDSRNIVSAIENAFQTQVVRVIPDDVATEYRAEIERRRQIGVTIDPAIAETIFWYADISDPYCILDPVFHLGQVGREHFARNPGGECVHFRDLPKVTRKALWERDGHKLVFPYGLHPGDDLINYPPASNH
jgi:hypothetical protein